MTAEPFRIEQIEEKATEVYLTQLFDVVNKIKSVREAVRKDADSIYRRMQDAGSVRRLWKQTEETLPALIAEARAADWTPRYVFRGPARGPLASGPGMTVSPCRTDDLGGGVTGPGRCRRR
ncbi:hypothetical protein GR925_37260, partial [Streptomyces sp. HUCO-GS316]|uniref:hypothetical protein n=1 Tax=Streptomyces sp. HUCO-GS316 TaxID=2692198 RepID=UPI0013FFEBE6